MNMMQKFPPRGGDIGQPELPPLARWINGSMLDDSWTYKPGMMLLGHDGASGKARRYLGIHDNRHIMTIAGSRTGKTLTLLVPNLLVYPGSTVVIDPKGELYLKTAAARMKMGQRVLRLAPFAENIKGIAASHSFNPFADLAKTPRGQVPAAVGQLADALIIGNEKDPHWTDAAKNLLNGLILLLHLRSPGRATLRQLRRILTDQARLTAAWEEMALSDAFEGRLSSIGRTFLSKLKVGGDEGNRELESILSTAREQTRSLDDVAHILRIIRTSRSMNSRGCRRRSIWSCQRLALQRMRAGCA